MMHPKSSKNQKDSLASRKLALKKMGKNFLKMMLPFAALHAFSNTAKAQFEELEIGRALNFILQIEMMQNAFYTEALNTPVLIDPEYRDIFEAMQQHQQEHVVHIKNKLAALEVDSAPSLEFNFSAGGQLNPFNDFETFLALAQIFEDLGVGVYKSQVNLIHLNNADNELLRLVSRSHSTESRHACFVRQLRTNLNFDNTKEWISDTYTGNLPDIIPNIYVKEDRLSQADIDLSTTTSVQPQALREAWDEPIERDIAREVVKLFV